MVAVALNPILTADSGLWPLLAQTQRTAQNQSDIWFYLIVLVVGAFVVITIGLVARKMLGGPIETGEGGSVFDLSELRRLHREGQLTDEEFQVARAAALKESTGYLGEDAPPTDEAPRAKPGSHDIDLGPELVDTPDPPEPPDTPEESDKPGGGPEPTDNPPQT